jgi:hypothetical protein
MALVLASVTANAAPHNSRCPRRDASFAAFLARFRSDREFQTSRVRIPRRRKEGDEAAVCEKTPRVVGNTARLVQYSCHTDLFGNEFRFVARSGCWFLDEVRSSGG